MIRAPRNILALLKIFAGYAVRPRAALPFLWTACYGLLRGPAAFSMAMLPSVFYLHLERQTRHAVAHLEKKVKEVEELGEEGHIKKRGGFVHPKTVDSSSQPSEESNAPVVAD